MLILISVHGTTNLNTYRDHEQRDHVENAEIDEIEQFGVVHLPIDNANGFRFAVA